MEVDTANPSTAWRQLGERLTARRPQVDPRFRNRRVFAQENRVDYRVVFDIEKARRSNFSTGTITALEMAYRWKLGSIKKVLDGGEPDVEPAASVEPKAEVPEWVDLDSLNPAERQIWTELNRCSVEEREGLAAFLHAFRASRNLHLAARHAKPRSFGAPAGDAG